MRIKISYSGQLRKVFGVSQETRECAGGTTARTLVLESARKLPPDSAAFIVNPQGQPSPSILLFINDTQAEWDETAPLKDGDEIMLLSPLAGG